MNPFKKLIQTNDDLGATLIRVALGIVIFPHGAQKLLGWFGGYGVEGTLGYFSSAHGIPAVFGMLAIIAEFFGSIALVLGFLGRVSAFGIAATMVVAVLTSHLGNGFFMNWTGQGAGEGFEYHILAVAMAAVVMIKGSGAYSIDRVLASDRSARAAVPTVA